MGFAQGCLAMRTSLSMIVCATAAVAVAASAQADMVGTTLNTLNPASPMVVQDQVANGAASGLLPNLAIDTFNSGVIAGGSVTLTESNAAAAAFSSGYFQARALSGTVVDLSAFSSGGIRFSYNAAWAAASPTLKVSVRINDGVSTTYSAFVATQASATGFTINWSQLLSGGSSLGDNLGRLSSVNMVEIRATGFSSAEFSSLEVVPAPGAIALLGVAGLAGSRRRR
jgi:hypothetical protein